MSDFKEGDWNCSSCGDHQFARNAQCRRCGAPKPVVSSNKQVSKPGDWICPNPACQDLQFEKNQECRRCGAPKPGRSGLPDARNGEMYGGKGRGPCLGGGSFSGGLAQVLAAADAFTDPGASLNGPAARGEAGSGAIPAAAPRPSNNQSVKEGDWICASCGDHQFARNSVCRNCGAAKPGEDMGTGARSTGGFARSAGGGIHGELESPRPSSNNQDIKEGDWICSNCGDHQFARNSACRRCGAAKPGEGITKGKGGTIRATSGAPGCKGGWAAGYPGYGCGYGAAFPGYGGYGYGPNAGYPGFKGGCGCGWPAMPPYMAAPPYAVASSYTAAGGYGGDMTSGKGLSSKGSGGGRGGGGASFFQPGDWTCGQCGDHQFGRNEVCRRCGASKPVVSSNNQTMKAGDWICPNPECKDMVFAKNDSCRKCGTPRPGEDEDTANADRGRSRSPRRR